MQLLFMVHTCKPDLNQDQSRRNILQDIIVTELGMLVQPHLGSLNIIHLIVAEITEQQTAPRKQGLQWEDGLYLEGD